MERKVIARFLEEREDLAANELEELLGLLEGDPQLAAQFKDLLVVDNLLSSGLRMDRRGFIAQVHQRVRDRNQGTDEDVVQLRDAVKAEHSRRIGAFRPAGASPRSDRLDGHAPSNRHRRRVPRHDRLSLFAAVLVAGVLVAFGVVLLWGGLLAHPKRLAGRAPRKPAKQGGAATAGDGGSTTGDKFAWGKAGAGLTPDGPAVVAAPPAQLQSGDAPIREPSTGGLQNEPGRPSAAGALPAEPPQQEPGLVETSRPGPETSPRAEPTEPAEAIPQTVRPIARIAKIVGRVMFLRGGQQTWNRAVEGISLLAGDRLDTRTGMARLDLERATVYANKSTTLQLPQWPRDFATTAGTGEMQRIDLSRGEVYVESHGRHIRVATRDGIVSPVGTRFGVKRLAVGTLVTVAEGEVTCAPDRTGKATRPTAPGLLWVRAGYQVRMRRGTRAGTPVRRDPWPLMAWTAPLRENPWLHLRAGAGLQALYTFREGRGDVIRDVSGVGAPLHLMLRDPSAVRWLPGGGLEIRAPTVATSDGPADKVIRACPAAGAISVEAWIRTAPYKAGRVGPHRIVTLSQGANDCNVTLGVDGLGQAPRSYGARLRTTATTANGTLGIVRGPPVLATPGGTVTRQLTHVVFTRDPSGQTRFYVNGVMRARGSVGGKLTNWDESYTLSLANEQHTDRHWLGTFHLVALYARALSPGHVRHLFGMGAPGGRARPR